MEKTFLGLVGFLALAFLTFLTAIERRAGNGDAAGCSTLAKIPGPEDFEWDSRYERLLVSSQDRRQSAEPGAVYAVTPSGGRTKLHLHGRAGCSFHPHGVAFVSRPKPETDLLYVINHHEAEDTTSAHPCPVRATTSIEVYEVHEHRLEMVQRHVDPDVLSHANDIVADRNGDIFVTVPPRTPVEYAADMLAPRDGRASHVAQYTCERADTSENCQRRWTVAFKAGRFVNGIAFRRLPDGKTRLLLSSSIDGRIFEAIRVGTDWRIEQQVNIGPGLDNLTSLDESGNQVLVAASPDLRRLMQHALHPSARSPSGVWRMTIGDVPPRRPTFLDTGSRISGASKAMCVEGRLILGQIFGEELTQCQVRELCPDDSRSKSGGNR